MRVGDPGTVMPGTRDPDLLFYAELSGRLLVTNDRKTMRGHLGEHWAKGRRIWGLFWVRPNASVGQLAETLVLVWAASAPGEWLNRVDWIPESAISSATINPLQESALYCDWCRFGRLCHC